MKKYRILNLYACLGGNRYKWDEVIDSLNMQIEVVAVELNTELAEIYKKRFPNDTVIVADAHDYLINHFKEFDFIWSSPPCPTHSRLQTSFKNRKGVALRYPDMKLYEEIIFLNQFFEGKFCVENVIPYYELLMPGQKRGRHIYWTNFNLPQVLSTRNEKIGGLGEHKRLEVFHDFSCNQSLGGYRCVLRNLVDYEAGKTILETALGVFKSKGGQKELFI